MSSVNNWQRRSKAVSGHVAFPVDDPAYEYAPEGGLFVRLVVEPRDDEDLLICAGGWNTVTCYEEWFGDDTDAYCPCPNCEDNRPENPGRADFDCRREAAAFPRLHDPEPESGQYRGHDRYESVPYLAVLTIGSTGWVGYRKPDWKPFVCRYEHLTASGQALYQAMQNAYPGRRLILQTWLDT